MKAVYTRPKSLRDVKMHYCPGCGHSIIHKLLAFAIDELGIREKTIIIAPVGCSVLIYDYIDCDDKQLDFGALQGKNDFRRIGYGGPCPPGGTHRYYFKVYALDTVLDVDPGLTKRQLLKAMEGHILAKGELMVKYSR